MMAYSSIHMREDKWVNRGYHPLWRAYCITAGGAKRWIGPWRWTFRKAQKDQLAYHQQIGQEVSA